MSAMEDREALELRANEQRRRVLELVEAVDGWRHSKPGSPSPSPRTVAAATLTGLGVLGAVATLLSGSRHKKVLVGLSATLSGAGLALGVAPVVSRARLPPVAPSAQLEAPKALPFVEGPKTKPVSRKPLFWVAVVFLVLLVGARLALGPLATHFTQKGLDGLTGFTGTFSKVDVSIIPLSYTIDDLRLVQDGMPVEDAVLYVKQLRASAKWTDLLRGRVFAAAHAEHAHFQIRFGETEAPPEVEKAAKEGAEELARNDFNISKTLDAVIPFRIDRVEVADSEVTLVDTTDPAKPRIWVNDIEFVVENIVSRPSLDQRAPLMMTGRATVQKTGVLKLLVVADLLDEKPAFTGQAQLVGLNLESLYAWAASKAGLSPHGSVDVFVNFNSAKGGLGGDVKVLAKKVYVDALEGKFSNAVKAAGANAAFNILKDEKKGEAVGTTLPLRGSLEKPDAQLWPTVLGVLRNAFVDSLEWGFGDLPVITSAKKQNFIEQAVEGLDKTEPGPKAQPGGAK